MKFAFPLLSLFLIISCTNNKEIVQTEKVDDTQEKMVETVEEMPVRPVYHPSEKRINDIMHTRLEVSFDFELQHLFGKANIEIKPYFYPTDSLLLDARGFDIHEVELVTDTGNTALPFTYDEKVIRIDLGRNYFNDEKYEVEIEYTAKPNELEVGGSSAITMDKGLYFINPKGEDPLKPTQIWTQGETESNSCWFPTIDSPNERMTQEMFITVPDQYKTLSNGEMIFSNFNDDDTRTDYWKMELPHAPYLTMMAIGEYRVGLDKWEKSDGQEIPVNYYIEDEYSDYVFKIFGNTPEMISFYSEILDYEYPWSKYSQVVVRDFVSGAMENTTATIHGEFLNATDRELLDGDNEDVIAHELFHQWFGNLVTCESWANLPLNESFATYGEYLWMEYKYGKDVADHHAKMSMDGYLEEAKYEKKKTIRFGYADKELMFDRHSYNKGGRILHMLRNYLGDEAFFAGLSKYLKDNEYESVEMHDFRIAIEDVCGEDLNWFFNQWFFEKGHPVLDINYDWQDEGRKLTISIEQLQDVSEEPIFRLPIAIDIYEGAERTRHDVVIDQVKQEFVFYTDAKPTWVNVDGDKMLLCEKSDNKPADWFVQQFYFGENYLDRYESMEQALKAEGGEAYDHMIVDAMMDKFKEIKLMGIQGIPYVKMNMTGAENMVEKLVFDDESLVRAAAISAIGSHFDKSDAMDYYEGALKDPSYAVVSEGLYQMTELNPEKGLAECKKLESEDSFDISSTISFLYSKYGGEEQMDFYRRKNAEVSGYSRYIFNHHFAMFLTNQNENLLEEGVEMLTQSAENSDEWWVKSSAYKGLNQLLVEYDFRKQEVERQLEKATDTGEKASLDQELKKIKEQIQFISDQIDASLESEDDERVLNAVGN